MRAESPPPLFRRTLDRLPRNSPLDPYRERADDRHHIPLMVAIRVISIGLGLVSGHRLATNIRRYYPAWLLYRSVVALLVSNTINIAADLIAMGTAVNRVVGGPTRILCRWMPHPRQKTMAILWKAYDIQGWLRTVPAARALLTEMPSVDHES
jgi:Natural resistance-associated macrophage protein